MADFSNFSELVAKYSSTLPTLSDGQSNHLQVDSSGRLLIWLANASVAVTGTFWPTVQPVDDNGGSLTVDGTVTADAGTGPWPVTDNGGSLTVDGTVAVSGITGTVGVTQSTSPWVVSNGGTFAVQESGAALTALQLIDNLVLTDGAVWSAGSSGAELLAVRKDAAGPLTGVADGDLSPLQVNENGELKVAGSLVISNLPGSGTDEDVCTDEAGDGLFALTAGPDVITSIAVPTGTLKISGWSWASDRQCAFKLEVYDDTTLVKIIRVMLNSGSMPSDSMDFGIPVEVTGGTDIVVRVSAKRLEGTNGFASAGINAELV